MFHLKLLIAALSVALRCVLQKEQRENLESSYSDQLKGATQDGTH